MKLKRAAVFALLVYLLSSLIYFLMVLAFDIQLEATYNMGLRDYALIWFLNIPLILLMAKWYFKKDAPTLKKGFHLGLFTILVALLIDGLSIAGTLAIGESTEVFQAMYSDWKFYATILWTIALTTYAGYEFDQTFTKHPEEAKK
jgi:hypothetical protein